ncbi:hypothetical protein [Ruegeria sp. A3M17]|uniref:hypothetical protein n=1 Tax=Ruegeria sp. A3M17 TaxID=2267229 RepID=UPI000DE9B304|nr:hypothetical protein [Ruegeria sp. A3M17]RBW62101.1 hypothetical protein DS906_03215 [Ruegeria sp. A3M17]
MTKASDPKARPEVAKKDANKVSGIYDFVQSPEWQEVLDNARKQQENNPSAGKVNGGAAQPSEPSGKKPTQSTAGVQPANAPNVASGQPGTAGKPAQVTNSRQTGESVQNAAAGVSGAQTVNNDSRATENVPSDERGEASAAPPNGAPVPGMHSDNIPEDLINPEPSLKLSDGEVADRLRKNLLERIEDQKRSRRKMRLGMMAAGCGIGVVASSSVFLILSGLSAPGPNENVGLASQEALATSAITQQDAELAQSPESSSEVTRDAEDLVVSSTTVFDTSAETISPNGDTGASEDLASLSLPLPEASGPSGGIEPEVSGLAPNVRSFVPTLVQPPLPITPLSYRPREEVNLGFVRFQSTPEIFSTSVALLETTVTAAEPEEFLEAVTVTATVTITAMRPPVVPIPPGALENAASQVPLDVHQTMPEHARAYQPDVGTQTGEATVWDLSLPEALASLEIEEPPEARVLVEPGATSSNTVASDLAVQQDGTGFAAEITQPLPSEPQPELVELAALPVAPELSDAPSPLVTPAPSQTSSALQVPTLAPTPDPLETPNSPRTPLPLDAVVSLAPLLQEASTPSKPIERTALPDEAITPPEPESVPANTEVAFRIYAPTNVPQDVVDSVVTNLTSTGHELSGQARVGFGITQSNVRFYHKQDEERATALARDSGALLRDFTGSNVKTPSGIIELWLAGEGSGVAAVKRTTTRSTARAKTPNRVNRLKSQVLSKLKKATTQ